MPGLMRLGDGVGLTDSNRALISTAVDLYDEDGQLVGYATGIERTDRRTVTKVRHLSSADAGRVVEQVPSPEDVVLRVTGFALFNKQDLSGRIPHYSLAGRLSRGTGNAGFGGVYLFKSLNSQKFPFTLKEENVHPQTLARATTFYHNCMLTDYTKPMNLGTVTVAETCSVQVGQVDELQSSQGSNEGIVIS